MLGRWKWARRIFDGWGEPPRAAGRPIAGRGRDEGWEMGGFAAQTWGEGWREAPQTTKNPQGNDPWG